MLDSIKENPKYETETQIATEDVCKKVVVSLNVSEMKTSPPATGSFNFSCANENGRVSSASLGTIENDACKTTNTDSVCDGMEGCKKVPMSGDVGISRDIDDGGNNPSCAGGEGLTPKNVESPSVDDDRLVVQVSNNNQYIISNDETNAINSAVDLDEMAPVALSTHNENAEDGPSSSSISSGSNATAEDSQDSQNAPSSSKTVKTKTKNLENTLKKTFEQLNPTEIRVLRSNLSEVVKSPDIGTPSYEDDYDDDYTPWSGGIPNQHPLQQSAYSNTTESSDSILDTEKESDLSVAEFDFASVIPNCKGTTISFQDRTQEDAQNLLNQIINGEPDPCLGPDGFGVPKSTDGDGNERKRVVVKVVSSDPVVSEQENADSEGKEEGKNVSLHNAVAMNGEKGGGNIGTTGIVFAACQNSRSPIVTSDTRQQGLVPVSRESLNCAKVGYGDCTDKTGGDVNGGLTRGDDVGDSEAGGVGHCGEKIKDVDGGGGTGDCEKKGDRPVVNVNADDKDGAVCGEDDDSGVGSGRVNRSCLDIPEKDENHMGSYEDRVRQSSIDDSIIDSVIMENCDDGGEEDTDAATTTTVNDDGASGNGDDANNDDGGDGESDRAAKTADVEDSHAQNGNSKKNGREVAATNDAIWDDFGDFDDSAEDKMRHFESNNVIYANDLTFKRNDTVTLSHQAKDHNPKQKQDTQADEDKNCLNDDDSKKDDAEDQDLDASMIEKQLKCNDNSLPFVVLPESHRDRHENGEEGCSSQHPSYSTPNGSGKDMTGAVCPCNSEVYSCDVTPNTKENCSNHVTRLNGIREILKATELYFDQNKAEIEDEEEENDGQDEDPSPLSVNPKATSNTKLRPPTTNTKPDSSLSRLTDSNNARSLKPTTGKQHKQPKLKAVSRTRAPSPGGSPSNKSWTPEKQKPVLPDINNKTKLSSKNQSRSAGTFSSGRGTTSNTAAAAVGTLNASSVRHRKSGLTVKRLNLAHDNRKQQTRASIGSKPSVLPQRPAYSRTAFVSEDRPAGPAFELEPNADGHQGDNPLQESENSGGQPNHDDSKNKETPSSSLDTSKVTDNNNTLLTPVPPSGRARRNVNANKINRLPRYAELINSLDLKRGSALSCSATSSACTMASFIREGDEILLFNNHGDVYDNRKVGVNNGQKLRGSSTSNESGWKIPVGGSDFIPSLRRPKLESSVIYKPKRHLNPKNASTEEYHRYKMDLRLSQSLAKIKRGPPTVDCYLDPRLHQKPPTETHRARSRSQKRLPEVTRLQ